MAAVPLCKSTDDQYIALAYRGCLTFGEFLLDERFLVGPAVDEAAELMNAAQGAFVWWAPSALARLGGFWDRQTKSGMQDGPTLAPYDVPIKGGDTFKTWVVTPFEGRMPRSERDTITASVERTFGSARSLGLAVKRQQTLKFVRYAAGRALPSEHPPKPPGQ